MPDIQPLDALRIRLRDGAPINRLSQPSAWGNPHAMSEVLKAVKTDFGSFSSEAPPNNVLQASLLGFARTEQIPNFTELKHVCYGITVPIEGESWRIIDRDPLFERLLGHVGKKEPQAKQFRRCYQGLLDGYFKFDRYQEAESAGVRNWCKLRGFLADRQRHVLHATAARGVAPDWLKTLDVHRNLLTEDPCRRYAKALADGTSEELKEVCAGLGIPSTSWVWNDALMAYVRLICEGNDRAFQQGLSGILDVLNGRADLKLAQMLATKATAISVTRYAHCSDRPEHPELRDTSLHWIGNPWLKRSAWDAHVNYEPARQMVEGWLKRRLIKDFFELLAQDGAADLRRLNYWLEWEPEISDMWFVLGADAKANSSPEFVELRKRMAGRSRTLVDPNSQNNAFVMRIGQLLVIEFGVTGNACYVFAAADFKTDLDTTTLRIHQLKQRALATRLPHQSHWEGKFDSELKRLFRSVPTSKGRLAPNAQAGKDARSPFQSGGQTHRDSFSAAISGLTSNGGASVTPIRAVTEPFSAIDFENVRKVCSQNGIGLEDNRSKGGAIWVLLKNPHTHRAISSLLERYGFQFTLGKGYWLKPKP